LTEITTSISWFFSIEGFLLTVSIIKQNARLPAETRLCFHLILLVLLGPR